jgi:hypothetical protein
LIDDAAGCAQVVNTPDSRFSIPDGEREKACPSSLWNLVSWNPDSILTACYSILFGLSATGDEYLDE